MALATKRLLSIGILTILTVLMLSRPLMGQALPELKPQPLPASLAQVAVGDDYADRLQTTPVGALLWTQFPVSVRIDLADSTDARAKVWQEAVTQAISDWSGLIELTQTTAAADITIRRASLPLRRLADGKLAPVRFADTRFEFYNQDGRLRHRMVITLSPTQADRSLLSGARHELGHALGIWGHSDRPTDVMYSSQVAQPPQISDRDRATLRKVYTQSTRLGGSFPKMP
ncbi:MAG: matrixin family metalloprotease [Alkalinema sp. RU_4_3]|nr:matrixin family metalloprotease [Alkalinema sp. RU_4_3]